MGITMVRNEEDIIESVVRHMLTQVDRVIVADNLSSDSTREILESIQDDRLLVVDDNEEAYYQSKKMTALAHRAEELGADWVVPLDADEIWHSHFGTLKEVLEEVPERIAMVQVKLYNHIATVEDDPSEKDPFRRLGWRFVEPGALDKVACRTASNLVIEQGNHLARYGHFDVRAIDGSIAIRHFPYRSAEQMFAKATTGNNALSFTNLSGDSGQHWRSYAALGEERLREVFYAFFYDENPRESSKNLIFDPAPLGFL